MRQARPLLALLGLFALLVVALLLLVQPPDESRPPLDSASSAPRGARALRLWLEDLGYRVEILETRFADPPTEAPLMLVLAPQRDFAPDEIDRLERWVKNGGDLLVALEPGDADALLRRFELEVVPDPVAASAARAAEPVLANPPAHDFVFPAGFDAMPRQGPLLPLVRTADRRVVVSRRPVEKGTVTLVTAPLLFSNQHIASADNARLVLNLIGTVARDGSIAIDETHRYPTPPPVEDAPAPMELEELLTSQPWGWAALYSAALALLWLLLNGRRFGSALPSPPPRHRSTVEYVTSLAGLFRRARQRRFVADHFARAIRRDLATRLGGDPDLPVAELARRGRGSEADALHLADVVARLERATDEAAIIRLVREAERLRDRIIGVERGRGHRGE